MKTTFTLLAALLFACHILVAKDVEVLWKVKRGAGYELMILKSPPQVRWGGQGKDEIYIHYTTPGRLIYSHPYMGMVAGLIEEGIAMGGHGKSVKTEVGPQVSFDKTGSIELIFESNDPDSAHTFILSREEALEFVSAIRRYYHKLLTKEGDTEQAGTGQPAMSPKSKSEGSDKPQPESEGRPR